MMTEVMGETQNPRHVTTAYFCGRFANLAIKLRIFFDDQDACLGSFAFQHQCRRRAGKRAANDHDIVIELDGNYLAPGFIDLHVHGALGRDTMEAAAEAFRCICDFHGSGGTTSLLLTTATAPIDKIVEVLGAVRDSRSSMRAIVGVHVEGPFISKAKR